MNIQLRPIAPNDNAAIAAVIREVMREHGIDRPGSVYTDPTTDRLYELFRAPGSCYFILEADDRILGGCGIFPTEGLPEGCAELVKLYVSSTLRGQGWGTELMTRSIAAAREMGYRSMYLESMPELSKAISLYERLGFKVLPGPLGNSGHYACNIWMLLEMV